MYVKRRLLTQTVAVALAALLMASAIALTHASAQDQAAHLKAAVLKMRTWTREAKADRLTWTSPATDSKPSVVLSMPLVDRIGGEDIDTWFKKRVDTWIKANYAGRPVHKQQPVIPLVAGKTKLLKGGASFKNTAGKGGDLIYVSSWRSRSGAQIAVLFLPEVIQDNDPAVVDADNFIAVMAGAEYELTEPLLKAETIKN